MTIRAEPLRAHRSSVRLNLSRFMPVFLLAGYGIFILSLFVRNVMTLYINPVYVAPATLAGAVLVALAVVAAIRPAGATAESCGEEGCECGLPARRLWPYLALCIPLFLAVAFPPRGLAVFSAMQRGPEIAGLSQIHGAGTVKRVSLSVDTRGFTIQDWAGALSADPNPADYTGKPVHLTGIVLHNPSSMPPGYIMVMRYQVTCCIADARPIGLIVRDTSRGALKDNQWVTVTGTMGAANYSGQKLAVVIPKSIAPTKAGDPYMY